MVGTHAQQLITCCVLLKGLLIIFMFVYDYMKFMCRSPGKGSKTRAPETGFIDGIYHGCWELNPGPRQDKPVLLTAQPSLWFLYALFLNSRKQITATAQMNKRLITHKQGEKQTLGFLNLSVLINHYIYSSIQ